MEGSEGDIYTSEEGTLKGEGGGRLTMERVCLIQFHLEERVGRSEENITYQDKMGRDISHIFYLTNG